jgi:lysozyme family protein
MLPNSDQISLKYKEHLTVIRVTYTTAAANTEVPWYLCDFVCMFNVFVCTSHI